MVQGLGANQGFGTITKVASTQNGRSIYEITNPEGQVSGRLSVADSDCDKFEKAYNDILESAPKIQEWTEKHSSPKEMERRKNLAKYTQIGTTVLAIAYPLFKGFKGKWGWMKGLGLTLAGFVGGSALGGFLAAKIKNPPGAIKFVRATQQLSKIDAQPVD